MSYPGLHLDAARSIDDMRRLDRNRPPDADRLIVRKTGADLDESMAIDCLNQCWDLIVESEDEGWKPAHFDSRCARLLHSKLQLPLQAAGDADFWRWLTFTHGYLGAEIVDWRYGNSHTKSESSIARPVYYGLGMMKKGMFAKLWICANMMCINDAVDPYDGIEYADVDLWDSHIIDVDYGSVPTMARAFVKVVRDLSLKRGSPNTPEVPTGYRDLAKEIRRRNATVAFEMFDDAEAYLWIKTVWSERASWCLT